MTDEVGRLEMTVTEYPHVIMDEFAYCIYYGKDRYTLTRWNSQLNAFEWTQWVNKDDSCTVLFSQHGFVVVHVADHHFGKSNWVMI